MAMLIGKTQRAVVLVVRSILRGGTPLVRRGNPRLPTIGVLTPLVTLLNSVSDRMVLSNLRGCWFRALPTRRILRFRLVIVRTQRAQMGISSRLWELL